MHRGSYNAPRLNPINLNLNITSLNLNLNTMCVGSFFKANINPNNTINRNRK